MQSNPLPSSRLTTVQRSVLLLALALASPLAAYAQAQSAAPSQVRSGIPPAEAPQPAPRPGSGPGLPDADMQAIKSYNLNDDIFNRLIATTKEARTLGIKPQAGPGPGQVKNLDDLAERAVSGDPRIKPLIKTHGFTPREFMLANLALMNAAIASQAKSDPQAASQLDQSKVNQANVAFFESHQAQLNALMQQAPPSPQGK
ncbi:hypothetical protein [Dyella tabacisoli]|nr:hypothetical protein [Dyella tabacisoli]